MVWIFAAVVLVLDQIDAVENKDIWHRYRMSVTIKNELLGGIEVHCKSVADDLHYHYLQSRGAPYFFSFHSNFWGTTTFWCTFNSGNQWNSFTVWEDHGFLWKKKTPCEDCLWIARTDAFYRAENGSIPVAVYQWRTDKPP